MPRIPTSLLRKAHAIDPLLTRLLPPCRDLRAAQNELRWLREHVDNVAEARSARGDTVSKSAFLRDLVKQRAFGKPLQYLLGSEYFGELEISCRPGVLIPRQDTATSVQRLARLIRDAQNLPNELRVLDLCTGTGCIPLLFHHELFAARDDIDLRALGVDVSNRALQLAVHNLERVRKDNNWVQKGSIGYLKADVLADPFRDLHPGRLPVRNALQFARLPPFWDVLISNPPYISPSAYWKTTTRSVRGFEPKLALVPPHKAGNTDAEQGDAFYQPILHVARQVEAKIVLLEIADLDQALRIARAARAMHIFQGIEIWREQPDEPTDAPASIDVFSVLGRGNARSVVCWRGEGAGWLGKSSSAAVYDSVAFPVSSPMGTFYDPQGTFAPLELYYKYVEEQKKKYFEEQKKRYEEDQRKKDEEEQKKKDEEEQRKRYEEEQRKKDEDSSSGNSQRINVVAKHKAARDEAVRAAAKVGAAKVSAVTSAAEGKREQILPQQYEELLSEAQAQTQEHHTMATPFTQRLVPETKLTEAQRETVIFLRLQRDWPIQKLATLFKCSEATVYRVLQRWNQHATVKSLPRRTRSIIPRHSKRQEPELAKFECEKLLILRSVGWPVKDLRTLFRCSESVVKKTINGTGTQRPPTPPRHTILPHLQSLVEQLADPGNRHSAPQFSQQQRKHVIQCFHDKWTYREMGAVFKTTDETIRRRLRRWKVPATAEARRPRGGPKALTDKQREQIIQYHQDGWPRKAIMDAVGCCGTSITNTMASWRDAGNTDVRRKRLTDEQRRRLVQYYNDGWSWQAITEAIGCGITTVSRTIARWREGRRQPSHRVRR